VIKNVILTRVVSGAWIVGMSPIPAIAQSPPNSSSIVVPTQPLTVSSVCASQLPIAINRVISRLPAVRWGVQVQTLSPPTTRKTLYARNATTLLAPASNNKLFTTAAALQKLGATYRIRTSVTGNSTNSSLATLRIIGRGDPSLKTSHLNLLAQRLSQRGIRQVSLLVGDDTYFRGAATNPNWDIEDTLQGFGAPVNSLMLNQNGIGLTLFPQTVGRSLRVQWDDPTDTSDWRLNNQSVTVSAGQGEFVEVARDRTQPIINIEGQLRAGSASEPVATSISNPGNYLLQKFRNALTQAKITVVQSTLVRATPVPSGEVELVFLDSPTLTDLLKETNQESNNIYAEVLLKTVGRVQTPDNLDARISGITAVKPILFAVGVPPMQYMMVDGSGLASNNRASAEALTKTLQGMAQSPNAQVFRASLPVAGVSGTLKNRFRGTAAQGRLQAKTGTISGVASLSGYLTPLSYPAIAFSILTNYSNTSTDTVRSAIDEIVLLMVRLRSC
jgi:serine-type D-Ala-D-Ala carboxypeptidase/endopeptidase (penicillin-binding protein 4)